MNAEWKEAVALALTFIMCILLSALVSCGPDAKRTRVKNCFDVVNEETYEYRH